MNLREREVENLDVAMSNLLREKYNRKLPEPKSLVRKERG